MLGKQISILCRQLNLFLNRELTDISISATELLYLGSLYMKDGLAQEELAREHAVDKAAVARTLRLMEKKGLILRQTAAGDKRSKEIYLTAKAKAAEQRLRAVQTQWIHAITEGLDHGTMAAFTGCIDAMVKRAVRLNNYENKREGLE